MDNNNDYNFEDIPDNSPNSEIFYIKFRERLEDVQKFPCDYIFKFIYPSSENTMKDIKKVFEGANVKYDYKASVNRKYTSISIKLYVIDADTVINYYKEVSKISGVIML